MKTVSVSVIIPVYNQEKYLRQCLDSVINQTLKNIEIICVDDGSTDDSLSILREYEKKDDRIQVYSQPNTNAGAARNHGLRYATGEYLSFLDSDDFFEINMLEEAYLHAKEQNAQVVVFRSDAYKMSTEMWEERRWTILEDNLPEKRPFAGAEVCNLFRTFVGWAWDKLFSREFITENEIRFQEQRTTNDLFFTYFALAKADRIDILEDVLAHHRIQIDSSLAVTREKSWDCCYHALCKLRKGLIDSGLYELYQQDFCNYCVHFLLWNLNTLSWPTQEVFFYKLKLSWFEELGVLGHEKSYFRNLKEYEQFKHVMEGTYSIDSLTEQNRNKQELLQCRRDLEAIRGSNAFRVGSAVTWLPRKLRGGIRCYRENGMKYTIDRAKEKVKHHRRRR